MVVFLCSLNFAAVSLPQKLLASGVQMESDPEELDDEVMAHVFVWIYLQNECECSRTSSSSSEFHRRK